MTDNSKLCKACQSVISTDDLKVSYDSDVDSDVDSSPTIYPHHANGQDLRGSAQAGCPLCTILWDFFSGQEHFTKLKGASFVFALYYDGDANPENDPQLLRIPYYRFNMRYEDSPPTNIKSALELRLGSIVIYALGVEDLEDSARYDPPSNTGNEETWNIVTQWIQKCRTNHSKCNQASQANWMPTRVLDVGTASNPRLCLHVKNETSPISPYITLSHCWGKIEIKKLTKANISQLTKSIDINELTKTFQEAIIVARRLGIQFLWIDSLCIIQDSREDWARESSAMGDVYKNALCNIAATAAPDGRTGCFLERNPLLARTCRLRIEGLPGPAPKSQVYDLARGDFWKQGISAAPLIQRGWVLQERTLAPRVIHFGKNQLFWECHELDSCEMFPDGVPKECLGDEYGGFGFKHFDPATDGIKIRESPLFNWEIRADRFWPLDPMVGSFILWRSIVETYTKCLLTNSQDKLVAISAIARQFQPILKDEYKAGLWRRHLAQHLLWKVVTPQSAALPTTDSKSYCAPSWSWASVPGPVFLNTYIARHDRPVMIEILEVKLETLTGDPMGMVTGGHIKVRGWLKQFPPRQPDDSSSDNDNRSWRIKASWPQGCSIDPDRLPIATDRNWYCLPILETLRTIRIQKDKGDWENIQGLVLLQTGRENEYRRVGLFEAYLDDAAKLFRRPTYPFRKANNLEADHVWPSSGPDVNTDNMSSNGRADEREGNAAETVIVQKTPAGSSGRRRIIPFFSGKSQKEESQPVESQDRALGGREWWRLGRQRNRWVEQVITII